MKLSLKSALLPSFLITSLALTACQNSSSSSAEAQDKVNISNESPSKTENSNQIDDNTMIKRTAEQKMIDTLTRYHWTLDTAIDNNAEPLSLLTPVKGQTTLRFSQHQGQNMISYSVGCNTMGAAYALQDSTITTEDSMSTKMSCGNLNNAENRLNELMHGKSQLSLVEGKPPVLTQVTDDATTLVWKGRMTAQAKYNSKGETLFWAIKPNSKPCTDDSTQTCSQVKSITYDDQGIKIDEGEWTEFSGTIDGYQPTGKVEEILRLQRYKLDSTTGDSADIKYAYVLDTVIESRIIE